MSAPTTTPDHLLIPGMGMRDDLAPDSPVWEDAEPADWELADLADWGPDALEAERLEAEYLEAKYQEADDLEADDPKAGDPAALRAGPRAQAHGDGGWFAAGGVADGLPPGPVLAGFAADAWASGLSRLTDDELIGVMRAARRLASWATAMELAAAGDLWRRRWAGEQAGDTSAAFHADDEIAAALTLTGRAADQVLSLAVALRRLPLTSRALTAGDIDVPRAMVIADEVTGLDNEHAAAVEQIIIGAAAGQTTGQLRAATRRAVLAADPRAARKRKERALQDARVERWDEQAGTAALAGRDLPPASVLAADQNLSALARQLKRAGAPGTLDQLRAQVYLALLTGASVGSLIPAGQPGNGSGPGTFGSPRASARSVISANSGTPASPETSGGSGTPASPGSPGTPASPGSPGTPASPGGPARPETSGGSDIFGSSDASGGRGTFFSSGTVNLTMPLATWLGLSDAPGSAAGYGPLDADDSRAIAGALAARADTKWCLTLTDSDGRPVAHGCARTGLPPSQRRAQWPTGPPGNPGTGSCGGLGGTPRDGPITGAPSQPGIRAPDRTWTFSLTLLAGDGCDHARETAAYRPSPALHHLIEIRHATCTYPGCRRPAARCDADHTVAYHRGGRTCLCNLAPLCRHHHAVKQSPGWALVQASPGIMTWTTPSGRRYAVGPSNYPC